MASVFGNPFADFLETTPEAAYFSRGDQLGSSPVQKRFFENQFRNVHNQFLGFLGSQIREGKTPTARFADFSESFPLQQEFYNAPPALRGEYSSPFVPRTRWITF